MLINVPPASCLQDCVWVHFPCAHHHTCALSPTIIIRQLGQYGVWSLSAPSILLHGGNAHYTGVCPIRAVEHGLVVRYLTPDICIDLTGLMFYNVAAIR